MSNLLSFNSFLSKTFVPKTLNTFTEEILMFRESIVKKSLAGLGYTLNLEAMASFTEKSGKIYINFTIRHTAKIAKIITC